MIVLPFAVAHGTLTGAQAQEATSLNALRIDQTTRLSASRLPPPVVSSSVRTVTKVLLVVLPVVNDSARPPSIQLSWL